MNQKLIISVSLIVFVVIITGILGYVGLVKKNTNINKTAESNSSSERTFPLNDGEAKYYVGSNFGSSHYLFYVKNNVRKSAVIINGDRYQKNVGDQVVVQGKFSVKTIKTQCQIPPCDFSTTYIEIETLQVIKAANDSYFINKNTYQDDSIAFSYPEGFYQQDRYCSSQDNDACTVHFHPGYNPYGKLFSFITYPAKGTDGNDRKVDWFANSKAKIISSNTIIKNNMQWRVMEVERYSSRPNETYYRIIHKNYLYEFRFPGNKGNTSDANAIKIIENILDTVSFPQD